MSVKRTESRLERLQRFLGINGYLDTVKGFKTAYSAFYDIDTNHYCISR